MPDELVDVLAFAPTDLLQRIPQFRFEAHAGSAALRHHVAIDQTSTLHGCPLSFPRTVEHTHTKKWFVAAQSGRGAAFSRSIEKRLVTLRSGTAAISLR